MADQTVRVENLPDPGGKHRIAFELMNRIADSEIYKADKSPDNPREYYLELYKECRRAVY